MPKKVIPETDLPYDHKSPESILRYAGKLTGRTLREYLDFETGIIGGTNTKGTFAQIVERGYFYIENNNEPVPDFDEAGIELKVTPVKMTRSGLTSKERLVLGIIDYNEVPEKGFDIFLDKNSRILILFYLWTENTDVLDYKFLKVVDWSPSEEELRIIREDWDIIEGSVLRGEAHLRSERHTKFLAANTKGSGHDSDYRTQPFSETLAKQRSLSFKASYMTSIFNSWPDVGEVFIDRPSESGSIFNGAWEGHESFEEYVLRYFDRFVGKTCLEIENALGIELSDASYQYYRMLTFAMMGLVGKSKVKEFEEADILIKTVRVKKNGTPKEYMSFPAFDVDTIINQTWEESDFLSQIDHEFFIPVFQFNSTHPEDENRKDLVFRGAFFWCVPDEDMMVIKDVWEDTRDKIIAGRSDFVKASDRRISHVRPHDLRKKISEDGRDITRKSFWFNGQYVKNVIKGELNLDSAKK